MEDYLKFYVRLRTGGNYGLFKSFPKEQLRDKEERNKITRIIYSELQKSRNRKSGCLYPSCTNYAISSHSIPKAILAEIAENGKLIRLYLDAKYSPDGGIEIISTEIGINEASIFNGFCSIHDSKIFKDIENCPISITNKKQMFLLIYRAFCKEYSAEKESYRLRSDLMNNLLAEGIEFGSDFKELFKEQMNCSLECIKWEDSLKQLLDNEMINKSYNLPFEVGYTETDYIPIYVSTVFFMQSAKYDINYNFDIYKKDVILFSLISVPKKNKGKIGFYYFYFIPHKKILAPVLRYLNSDNKDELQLFLSDLIVRYSENFYIGPSLWEKYSEKERELIKDFMFRTTNDRTFCPSYELSLWK